MAPTDIGCDRAMSELGSFAAELGATRHVRLAANLGLARIYQGRRRHRGWRR